MSNWQHAWLETGIRLTRGDETRVLSHAEIAALSNYDARLLGLPQFMNAVMVVRLESRIDHPSFRAECRLEPLTTLHDWAVYRRDGARLFVGERQLRLNIHQLALFEALSVMDTAGADVAARLRVWPALVAALQVTQRTGIIVQGNLRYLQLTTQPHLAPKAMARVGKWLRPAQEGDAWAMLPRRRYQLTN